MKTKELNLLVFTVKVEYDEVGQFCEGLAMVRLNGKYGFINQKGEEVVSLKYDELGNFYEGLARVNLNGNCVFINQKGEVVLSSFGVLKRTFLTDDFRGQCEFYSQLLKIHQLKIDENIFLEKQYGLEIEYGDSSNIVLFDSIQKRQQFQDELSCAYDYREEELEDEKYYSYKMIVS